MIATLLVLAFSVAALLTLWFRTEAIVEYARLFGVGRLLGLRGFDRWRHARRELHRLGIEEAKAASKNTCGVRAPDLRWLSYIASHEGFLPKLLTCPFCVAIWFAVFIVYFALVGRNKLILSPEEEFALEHAAK